MTSPAWQPNTLGNDPVLYYKTVLEDKPVFDSLDDSWCSQQTKAITATTQGSVIQPTPTCYGYTDVYYAFDFVPPTATATTLCDDAVPTWIYEVDQAPLGGNPADKFIKLSVDSENNKIWFKPRIGGTISGDWEITVNAMLPMSGDQ